MSDTRITFTLNKLVASINRNADNILRTEFQTTFNQFLFLVNLKRVTKTTSGELAKLLGVSPAAVSKRLVWFESRNLIRKASVESDHRQLQVEITSAGTELTEKMSNVLESRFRTSVENWEGRNLAQLNDDLLGLFRHFEQLEGDREAA